MVCTGVLQIMGSVKPSPQQGLLFSVGTILETICNEESKNNKKKVLVKNCAFTVKTLPLIGL